MDNNELGIVGNEEVTAVATEATGINYQWGSLAVGFAAGVASGIGAYIVIRKLFNIAKAKKAANVKEEEPKTETTES